MEKFSSSRQVIKELRKVLAYCETVNPSRERIATDLKDLSDAVRTAGNDSFLSSKLDWAEKVAKATLAKLSSLPWWKEYHVEGEVDRLKTQVILELESHLEWKAILTISVQESPIIEVEVTSDQPKVTQKFKISEDKPIQDTVATLDHWLSKLISTF